MKKLCPLLLVFAVLHAKAQKPVIDSLQAMPQKLFEKSSILNCTIAGYRNAYMYRFMFSGSAKPIKALLRHEMGDRDGYTVKVENDAFNKSWYRSKDVASYLQNWIFEIVPSRDTFKLGSWMEGINPNGESDRMYVMLPGGRFTITKGLDTVDYRHWKLFMETKTMQYDSTSVDRQSLPVNTDPSVKEDTYDAKYEIKLTVYGFWNKTNYVRIAKWGDLFFPFEYGLRKKSEPQFRLSSIQMGFD